MKTLLDTSILCTDFPLSGQAFRVFFAGVPRVGLQLLVPAIVVDETVNKYAERLRAFAAEVRKLSRESERLTGRSILNELSDESIAGEVKKYEQFLLDSLRNIHAEILPYPRTPHEEVVRRALNRRRPFKGDGSGYRDALIWQSILELLNRSKEPITLVTANKIDFGEGPRAHEDLLQDLHGLGLSYDYVRIYRSLDALNQELILPVLERVDEMIARLERDVMEGFSLRAWVVSGLQEELWDQAEMLAPFEPGHGSAYLRSVDELKLIAVDDVRLLPGDKFLIAATAHLSGTLVVSADPDDFVHSDVREFFGSPGDVSAEVPVHATVAFSLVLDGHSHAVLSREIDWIDGDYARVDFNPHPKRPS